MYLYDWTINQKPIIRQVFTISDITFTDEFSFGFAISDSDFA